MSNHKKKKSPLKQSIFILWLITATLIISYTNYYLPGRIVIKTLHSLGYLFLLVGIASFVGSIFEYKAWYGIATLFARPLLAWGRLPDIAGIAFITAIFSNNAANTIISDSYKSKNITRREMIISGLCNSYPALISHSLRVLFPLLTAIGTAAIWYYSFTFGAGLFMTFLFLTINRYQTKTSITHQTDLDKAPLKKKNYSWQKIFQLSFKRVKTLLFRLLYITVPIYFAVAFMSYRQMFDSWKEFIPTSMQQWLTPEIMAILTARLGGLVNAAGVASEFMHHNRISTTQVVLGFLIGNIVTNPIRTIRRYIPTALGIFPNNDGLWIIFILQSFRLILTLLMIFIIIKVYL